MSRKREWTRAKFTHTIPHNHFQVNKSLGDHIWTTSTQQVLRDVTSSCRHGGVARGVPQWNGGGGGGGGSPIVGYGGVASPIVGCIWSHCGCGWSHCGVAGPTVGCGGAAGPTVGRGGVAGPTVGHGGCVWSNCGSNCVQA